MPNVSEAMIRVYLPRPDARLVEAMAEKEGRSVSNFMRRLVVAEIARRTEEANSGPQPT